jgi:hypothetical protein
MAPAGIVFSLIRSGRQMNAEAREQMAARKLRSFIETDIEKGPEVRQLLKAMSAYEVAKHFGLLA